VPTQSPRPSQSAQPSRSSTISVAPTGPAKIVVADDDRLAREMLVAILRGAGHVVESFEDGQEVIERVVAGDVDLVLLDIVMPRLSGLEACRLLKGISQESFVPVVLVTVKTDTAAMLRIKRLHDHVAEQRKKLEQMSIHDEMTGLYNYRYLHTRVTEEFKRAERYHEPFACAVVDIDHLKQHNEDAGREAGNAVICGVAEAITRCVREVDVVARYGGEEFLLVLPSTHFAGSVTVAERIWREVGERPIEVAGKKLRPTISIGIALYPSRDVRTKDALLRAADAALSQAKREGGNRICIFQQQGYIYTPASGPVASGPPDSDRGNPSP